MLYKILKSVSLVVFSMDWKDCSILQILVYIAVFVISKSVDCELDLF